MTELLNSDGTPKISCHNADCENDQHCFRPKPTGKTWNNPTGDCKYCERNPVDWTRVRKRDTNDSSALKDELSKEWIRNHFWEKTIDDKSIKKLSSMTVDEIHASLKSHLEKCVGPAKPFKDGMRVPIADEKLAGNPFAYAQHATASCCTKCAYYWWGYERDTQYSDTQIQFLTNMCMEYFRHRNVLPDS